MLGTVKHCSDHSKDSGPVGYVARYEWNQKKMKTHRSVKCNECKLWVWVPKKKAS